jgi:hypothetical protein
MSDSYLLFVFFVKNSENYSIQNIIFFRYTQFAHILKLIKMTANKGAEIDKKNGKHPTKEYEKIKLKF